MLRTRLWMGAILITLAVGALVVDQRLAPVFPFLLIMVLGLAVAGSLELLLLLPSRGRPAVWSTCTAVAFMVCANWIPHVFAARDASPWFWLALTTAAVVLNAFLNEMMVFREPGESVPRLALTSWIVAYLGLLPSFFVQLRWLPDPENVNRGTVALLMAIFVPKTCDMGAYFTGRLLGRHKLAPVLSPKKTWEGAAGGMVTAVLTAIALNRLGPALAGGMLAEIGFGLSVGLAGLLGDLAESLIKRDCEKKDASQMMPGFGGILDVVDSIVFAAPVAYLWFVV